MTTYSAGEQTRINMIQAAGELAAESGFAMVSTRAVAERSGENIGSIHYHFGGKDGLFEAVVREAIGGCIEKDHYKIVANLDAAKVTLAELSRTLRMIVREEISDLFRSDRPQWHSQVIYQLLQREDALFDLFQEEVLNPGLESMKLFFRLIEPQMSDDEVLLRMVMLKMPIFAHANYMTVLLKRMNKKHYSEEYLQKMEDLLVCQTQQLLGLPDDLEEETV